MIEPPRYALFNLVKDSIKAPIIEPVAFSGWREIVRIRIDFITEEI